MSLNFLTLGLLQENHVMCYNIYIYIYIYHLRHESWPASVWSIVPQSYVCTPTLRTDRHSRPVDHPRPPPSLNCSQGQGLSLCPLARRQGHWRSRTAVDIHARRLYIYVRSVTVTNPRLDHSYRIAVLIINCVNDFVIIRMICILTFNSMFIYLYSIQQFTAARWNTLILYLLTYLLQQ